MAVVSTQVSDLTTVAKITLAEIVEGATLVGTLQVGVHTEVQVLRVGTSSVHQSVLVESDEAFS